MEKFNPFNNSPLPEKIKLAKKETSETFDSWDDTGKKMKVPIRSFVDRNSGDEYIEKRLDVSPRRQNPSVEHFVSLLTKGVLHSSDFIEKNEKYYSRKMDLENSDPVQKGELESELFLLRYAFCDWDKLSLGQNLRTTEENKFAHYDYAEAFNNVHRDPAYSSEYSDKKIVKEIKEELKQLHLFGEKAGIKKSIKNFLTAFGFPVKPKMPEAEKDLEEKSEVLKERLQDDSFWNAIIEKSGLDIMSDNFRFLSQEEPEERILELRRFMILRLTLLIDVLKKQNA